MIEHRPREGLAHDDDAVDRALLDGAQQFGDIELAVAERDDAPTKPEVVDRAELSGAVHQRARHQHHRTSWLRWIDAADQVVDAIGGRDAGNRVAASAEHVEEIVLTPHDTLGHAGGASGVEQQQIVAATGHLRHTRGDKGADNRLVWRCPLGTSARLIADHVPPLHLGEPAAHGVEQITEHGVEHDRFRVGVIEQIEDLFGCVAIVGIHRRHRRFERTHHRLEVLGRVVEVTGELALMGHATVEQICGQRIRALLELSPGEHTLTLNLTWAIGHPRRHRRKDLGNVPVRHRSPTSRCVRAVKLAAPSRPQRSRDAIGNSRLP